jgi:hypothetical protein
MAAYIEADSDPQVPPPYLFPGVTVRSFRLGADIFQLQAVCDKFLNIGSLLDRGFEYRAIAPFVDLEFLTYPRMLYGAAPYSNWGFSTQQELYFKFFVAKFVLIGSLLLPSPDIICFFPYIFVDNPWSAFAGREVIGFPKLIAAFQSGSSSSGLYPIEAQTEAIDAFAPTAELTPLPFVSIGAAAAPSVIPFVNSWTLSATEIQALDPILQEALELAQASDPGVLLTVHLKQLRDPGEPTNAAYQAIVEGQFAVANLQPFGLATAEITLFPHATLSIGANLGLSGPSPLQPLSQFAATCDLTYEQATTVFVNS